MSFRLVQNSMILNDLEQRNSATCDDYSWSKETTGEWQPLWTTLPEESNSTTK